MRKIPPKKASSRSVCSAPPAKETVTTSMNRKENALLDPPSNTLNIISGTKEKRSILDAYRKKFGALHPDSNVS
jgi:hypothetical protein